MTRYLVYTPPAAGHVFPLVPGLRALIDRGHEVHVRTAPALAETLRAQGITAEPVDERITADMRSAKRGGADAGRGGPRGGESEVGGESGVGGEIGARGDGRRAAVGLGDLLRRGPWEMADLRRAIDEVRPDVLLVDTNTYGAATVAEASGLPWAHTMYSVLPLPGPGIPPYGLGMAPRGGPLGRIRDAVLWKVVEKVHGRATLPALNRMRAAAGLPAVGSPLTYLRRADRLIVLTGEPLEYPRAALEPHVRLVGGGVWDPPAETPEWLTEGGDPWVLVTCSTDFQADGGLAVAAVEALRDEPVRVLVTLADAYGSVAVPQTRNARVEKFVPHAPVLARAAAVICPAGMGIVTKSVAAGVPVVAVPFGRDQPEVARRVQQAGAGVIVPARRLTADRLRAAVRQARALPVAPRRPADQAAAFADAAEELSAQRSVFA